ncbi:acyltransferase [Rhodoplanes roseus]|uniref:Acetyltransferase n=1 Tax=Rhodoplanes roseus TaxID=29409 RepID=A0A327L640_9BRAD|nr:acyltransferase [Rhodoplanes roseus]RAI45012.1 hypothetical protein CH341_06255 [Rhodoplanes roseus]
MNSRSTAALLLQVVSWALPWGLRRHVLVRVLGFDIAHGASIGFSLVSARSVRLGPFSRIGHLTLVRNLDTLELGEHAIIGNLNKIAGVLPASSGPFADQPDRVAALVVDDHAAITNSHLIDCTDRVEIGSFATLAGWGTQILTHSIDFKTNRQRSGPVRIGRYSFVGTRCVVLKGAVLPERSVLAAGSVLASHEAESFTLYSGVPAISAKRLDPESLYFSRTVGPVA